MLRGEPYDSRDPELLALAHHARALLARLTATASIDTAARQHIVRELLGSVGDGVWIETPFCCDYGRHIHIGADTFVNVNCVFLDSAEIRIGANVLIGPGVQLLTVSHPVRASDRIRPKEIRTDAMAPYVTFARPITIGDNVWLGAATIVMPGVSIGENTTVAAGSIVTADVPPNSLAIGRPARVQRSLESS
jgi:maltose O-acetyltransferase